MDPSVVTPRRGATDTTVLIVGAGAAGLTSSLLLSRLGIANRIVERRRDIHAVDLGAERSRHRLRFDVAVGPSGHASHHVSFGYSELK